MTGINIWNKHALAAILLSYGLIGNAAADSADACYQALDDGYLEQAMELAEQALEQGKQQSVLLCKGRVELGLGKFDAALASFNAAESLATTLRERITINILKGNTYKAAALYPQAQSSYEAVLALANQENNQAFQHIAYLLIGDALLLQEQFTLAEVRIEHAFKLAANNNERADAKEHLARLKAKQGSYQEAIEHQVQAVVMHASDGSFDDYANAGLELGSLHIAAQDYVNAEKNLNRIIRKAESAGEAYWIAKGRYYLGLCYAAMQQSVRAKDAWTQALELSESIGAEKLAAEVNLQLKNLSE